MHDDLLANGIGGHARQSLFAPVFKDELDGVREALAALLNRPALAVGTGDLGAVADEPLAIALEYAGELVCDTRLLRRPLYTIGSARRRYSGWVIERASRTFLSSASGRTFFSSAIWRTVLPVLAASLAIVAAWS
jgi:hypothetical protein